MRLHSKTQKFKKVVEKILAPRCSSGLLTLNVHFLDQLLDNLGKFESFLFMDLGPLKQSNV